MTYELMEIDPEFLNKIEKYCEEVINEIELAFGGRPETHSFRLDQAVLNLIESFVEYHFQHCEIHEKYLEKIRKSKSLIINEKGKIGLTKIDEKRINDQAKKTIMNITNISQKLRNNTGVPAEIFVQRLLMSYLTVLTRLYREVKAKYMGLK